MAREFLTSLTTEQGLVIGGLFSPILPSDLPAGTGSLTIGEGIVGGDATGKLLFEDSNGTLQESAGYRVDQVTNLIVSNLNTGNTTTSAATFANGEWSLFLDETTVYGPTLWIKGRGSDGVLFDYKPRLAFGLPIAGPGTATNDDGSICFQNTNGNLDQAEPGEFTYTETSNMLRAPSHVTTATAAQTAGDFNNGEVAMWLDATAGTPLIHFRGKDSAGNVFDVSPGTGIGTVTSVNLTAPAAGITVSGGPITTSGSITLTLADDLAAVEGLSGSGLAVRTGTSTWTTRTITGTADRITVSNGDGVSGNPTLDIAATYVGQTSITTLGTIATGTWSATTIAVNKGGTGQTSYTDGQLLIGNSSGNTLTKATLTAPAAGITITNGNGSITFALADDLAALEALSGTDTIYYRSGASTWTAVTIGTGLTFSGGTLEADGSAGTVTSVDVSGGTTGLTFSGGPITTSGTITMAGTLAVANGGTGATTAANARTNLGLVIGTNVQAYDATLAALAALSFSGNEMIVSTGADLFSVVGLGSNQFLARNSVSNIAAYSVTDFGLSLIDDGTASGARTTLGLGTAAVENTGTSGTNVPLLDGTNSWSGAQTFLNSSGVQILDTNASHTLGLIVGSNLTANRTLTITTGDSNRTLTFSGNADISGTNTGDQSLTGDVAGSGPGPITATIQDNVVTYAKMQNVSAAERLLGRGSGSGSGDPQELSLGAGLEFSAATQVGVVAASDTVAGRIEIATAAEQETGTDTTRAVTPGRQHSHKSAAKAWVVGTVSGTTLTVHDSYNCSMSRNGVGDYSITFTTAFSSANYTFIGANCINTAVTKVLFLTPRAANPPTASVFRTAFSDKDGSADEPGRIDIVFFGDQ